MRFKKDSAMTLVDDDDDDDDQVSSSRLSCSQLIGSPGRIAGRVNCT